MLTGQRFPFCGLSDCCSGKFALVALLCVNKIFWVWQYRSGATGAGVSSHLASLKSIDAPFVIRAFWQRAQLRRVRQRCTRTRNSWRQRCRLHRHRQRQRQRQHRIFNAIQEIRCANHRQEATVLDAAVLCSTDLREQSSRQHRSERSGLSSNGSGRNIPPATLAKGERRRFPPIESVSGSAELMQNLTPRQSRPHR